jgi:predicted Zn-dependent protease with MMP-like domain
MSETVSGPPAWRSLHAPSLAEFEAFAVEVFRGLPEEFGALCADLVIQIEDFPTDEVLDHMGIESPFDLQGLADQAGVHDPHRRHHTPVQGQGIR